MAKRSEVTPVYVYAIVNPVTEQVVYVGKSGDLVQRWKAHICGADRMTLKDAERRTHGKCYAALKEMAANRIMPSLRVLQTCETDEAALVAERKWTVALLEKGHPIANGKNLKLGRQDTLRALSVNVRLTHMAEVAAELLETVPEDKSFCKVAKMLRRALIDVDALVAKF